MRFLRTRLLIAFVGVMCLTVAFLTSAPASAHAASSVQPLASGGGCATSPDGAVGSCISISGSVARPDAYIHLYNNTCASIIEIRDYDVTTPNNPALVSDKTYGGPVGCLLGHWAGLLSTIQAGHAYVTWTKACYLTDSSKNTYFCEFQESPPVYN